MVGVHGVGQLGNPPPGIVKQWWEALARGQLGCHPPVGLIEQDFSLAYYAPLYQRSGTKGLGSSLDVHDLTTEWEKNFLLALASEAERNLV
jgi:hypothetical protein